ncbi:MAG: LCP family protein [Alicyclobacillaceae bacterium]|nr:LCP family protein [Alicyclobacillaceae bacterium]
MKKRKRWLWVGVAVFLLAVLAIGGYYAYAIHHFVNAIHRDASPGDDLPQWSGTDRVNVLLMGVDNRNHDSHPRSDSMVLVSVDPQTRTAQMFSIMRDTWYRIPGYGYEKINAGFALGGPELAVQTIEDFLRIPIHFYVVTDFVGFEKLVDTVGGVDLNVEKQMDYVDDGVYDIHLKPGFQHLDGRHALMYVRFRHDAMSDFGRTQRQREFLLALAERLKTTASLAKLPVILREMEPYVQTNMTLTDMIELANLMRGIDISQVQTAQIPQSSDLLSQNVDGQAVLIPHVSACRRFVHQMLGMADADTVLASAAEDYYWNLYQNGGPQRPAGHQVAAGNAAAAPAAEEQKAQEPAVPVQEKQGTLPSPSSGAGMSPGRTDSAGSSHGSEKPTHPSAGTGGVPSGTAGSGGETGSQEGSDKPAGKGSGSGTDSAGSAHFQEQGNKLVSPLPGAGGS